MTIEEFNKHLQTELALIYEALDKETNIRKGAYKGINSRPFDLNIELEQKLFTALKQHLSQEGYFVSHGALNRPHELKPHAPISLRVNLGEEYLRKSLLPKASEMVEQYLTSLYDEGKYLKISTQTFDLMDARDQVLISTISELLAKKTQPCTSIKADTHAFSQFLEIPYVESFAAIRKKQQVLAIIKEA